MTDPMVRKLAQQLVSVDKRVHDLETVPQLAHSSIDDASLPVYDRDGNLVTRIGKQEDGTWGAPPLAGPTPPTPRGVSATGGPGSVTVNWSGEYEADAPAPLDFDTLEVLIDGTLAGSLPNRDGGSVTISAEQGMRFVYARVRTLVPRHSPLTMPFSVEVGPPADKLFLDAQAQLDEAQERIDDAKARIDDEREAREEALQAAQKDLEELDRRLAQAASSEALEALRSAVERAQEDVAEALAGVDAARDAATAAAQDAQAAQKTADDAAASALAAAGIARDKGRIFYQAEAPTGDAQSTNNLWIDSDNGKVYVWDGEAWAESQSEDLRDAAQAALVAQQTADAAVQAAADARARAEEAYAEAAGKTSPEQVQAIVKLSADGKNAIVMYPGEPTASGTVAGDTWWQVDGAGSITGQWVWDGENWVPTTIQSDMIANLDVGKLTVTGESRFTSAVVERLFTDIFTAHKITASEVNIVSLDENGNLAPGSVGAVTIKDGAVTADKMTILGDPNDPKETGLVANIAAIMKLAVENLTVTDGAVINSAVLKKLAAEMVTAGVISTADKGQRVVIDRGGVVLYGLDGDGEEFEMVRIGPAADDNLITIGETTVSADSVSSPAGSFDTLSVGGNDLADILAPLPRGRVAQNRYLENSDYSTMAQSRIAVAFDVEPYRRYRITVSPFFVQGQSATAVSYRLVYSWDKLATTWDSPGVGLGRSSLPDGNIHTVPGISVDLPTSNDAATRPMWLTLLVRTESSSVPVRVVGRGDYPLTISVDDLGPRVDDYGAYWTYGNYVETAESVPTKVAAPTVTRYTKTWVPQGYGGDLSSGEIVQGQYGGYGNRSGSWTMPGDMRAALQGSTIEKLEIYLYATHWYYAAGGPASIRATDGSAFKAFVGSAFTSSSWPRNAGRWVAVPSSWFPYFQNGSWKGIGVQTGNTSLTYYGRFTASKTRFRATYRK